MAVDRFRKHPVQTSLTLAGFVVGTASIILVVSLGLTGRGYVLTQIEGSTGNKSHRVPRRRPRRLPRARGC